jgi:Xaa-Pro aminopeptidase
MFNEYAQVTLLAVREVRQHAYIGIRESQVRALMLSALSAAGLESASALVLFGGTCAFPRYHALTQTTTPTENTVLPNGPGTDKELTRKDLITVSCGGRLHGYWSEVTRVTSQRLSFHPLI